MQEMLKTKNGRGADIYRRKGKRRQKKQKKKVPEGQRSESEIKTVPPNLSLLRTIMEGEKRICKKVPDGSRRGSGTRI